MALVPVGRTIEQLNSSAHGDRHAIDVHRTPSRTEQPLHRRVPAKHFLEHRSDKRFVLANAPLGGTMRKQRSEGVADQVGRCLITPE